MAASPNRMIRGLVAGAVLLLVTSVAAESPTDNDRLRDIMTGYVVALDAGEILGLAPDFLVSTTGESAALAAGLGLKHTAPVLIPPERISVEPNSDDLCFFTYQVPQSEANYQDWFGFWELDSLPSDWGPFGAPVVEHKDTTVTVNLVDSHRLTEGGPEQRYFGEMPEGDTQVAWEAHTQISDFWDIYFPSAMMLTGLASEYRRGPAVSLKAAGGSTRKADKLFRNLREVAINLAESASIRGAERLDDTAGPLFGDERSTVSNIGGQDVRVWDLHPPYFTSASGSQPIAEQTITIEATDFGGARFSRATVRSALEDGFVTRDDCNRPLTLNPQDPPSLLPIGDAGTEVAWTIRDDGPYNIPEISGQLAANQELLVLDSSDPDAGWVRTTLTQRVVVADTQAPILVIPDHVARYADGPLAVGPGGIEPGTARVIDRADPNPEVTVRYIDRTGEEPVVSDTPPASLGYGRHLIVYEAEDFTGNSTVAPADDPERYTQVVTIKQPDSNTEPEAFPTSATTRTNEAVAIQLTAQDTDFIGDRFDPLSFKMIQRPANGTFQTPTLPYFIEDFRAQPETVPDNTDGELPPCLDASERNSGPALEAKLGLLDVDRHDAYVEKCYCEPSGADREVPNDFVYAPQYVHVKDDGDYLVMDEPLECDADKASSFLRFSSWRDEVLLGQHRLPASARGRIGPFDVDALGRIWWNDLNNSTQQLSLESLDENFEQWYRNANGNLQTNVLRVTDDSAPLINPNGIVYAHPDVERGLIYVNDKRRVYVFSMSGNSSREALGTLYDGERLLTEGAVDGNSRVGFTMTSDSHGALYVADSIANRVHKFEASSLDAQGALQPGAYVGWLGRCSENLLDPERGVPYNDCDVLNKTSVGFACTDETCGRDNLANRSSGTGPGQFDVIAHLNLDPNDTLYVADLENQRIQRFGANGAFAGEAVSTGDGVTQDGSFVLGNMGPPRHVSVNGDAFHVLETLTESGDYFLHIFKSLPFRDVTDNSAWVDYVSDPRFIGSDNFSFLVDDGIDVSPPATVTVQVDRNFRAPTDLEATCWGSFTGGTLGSPIPCNLAEDTQIFVQLTALDPDGFIGFDGLDQHTFRIVEAPQAGALTLLATDVNQAIYNYVPEADFNGTDSFTFQASDGVDEAIEAGSASLTITPVQDPVTITFDDEVRFPRGFPQALTASFKDVDSDPTEDLIATSWDWGDGIVAREDSALPWENIGIRDDEDQPVDPKLDSIPVEGLLLGAHTYDASTSGITICMLERNTDIEQCSLSPPVEVVEVTRVTAIRTNDEMVQVDLPQTVSFTVTNQAPEGWAGLAVPAAELSITLPQGASLVAAPPGCSGTGPVRCAINLAVGASAQIDLSIQFALTQARVSPFFDFDFEVTGDLPRLEERNLQTLVVEASDRDDDGIIDADDAFPDDGRYQSDSDGDGMADQWEQQYGLNLDDPSDADLDPDSDGFSHRQEFRYDGTPLLADAYLKAEQLRLGLGIEDRIGFALAAADINGDGLEDVIMTAPEVGDNGALLVALGGADGVSESLTQLDGDISEFGKAVTAGDINGDGFADVVVGASDSAVIYLGSANGLLSTPAQVLSVPDVGFGNVVLLAEMDGDVNLDLLVAQPGANGEAGGILVYLGSSVFLQGANPPPSKIIAGPSAGLRLGASLAVGDLDNDGLADLLAGSVNAAGSVYGYLGSNLDWLSADAEVADFVLLGEALGDLFGVSLATGADIDGDGLHDLVVGAYSAGVAGAAYVYASSGTTWSGSPSATQRINGERLGDQFGVRVGMLPARGARTVADVLVGANRVEQGDEVDEGAFYLYQGGDLPLALTRTDRGTPHDMLGYSLLGTQDLNGDGRADAVASAPDIRVGGWQPDGGYVQIYYGGGGLAQSDSDGDGVADSLDSCPMAPNTDQADLDGDGAGDACDSDQDGDGLENAADNCPLLVNPDQADFDGDGAGDACDADDDNDGTDDPEDAFPLDERYRSDSDNDGMPDPFEVQAGLDPNDASDASQDLDGDGRSNLEEFEQDSDVTRDDVPPTLTVPATVQVDALGPLTRVALGAAVASDAKDGSLLASNDAPNAFVAGSHVVTWRAEDAAGNVTLAEQLVEVTPLIAIAGVERAAVEGQSLTIDFELSGAAVTYPVELTLALQGDATQGSDYTLSDTVVRIDSGERGSLQVEIIDDGLPELDETLTLVLQSAVNAVIGSNTQSNIVITEGDVAPTLALQVQQSGSLVSTVYRNQGPVQMQVLINDANADGQHAIDWSSTASVLVPVEGPFTERFTFDPLSVDPGLYRVAVQVIDSDNPAQPYVLERLLRVDLQAPVLSDASDADGDGASDLAEGFTDPDQNGLGSYRDAATARHWLPATIGDTALLQSEAGTRLGLGMTAYAAAKGALVTLSDVASYGDQGAAAMNVDDGYDYPGGVFDFAISNVQRPGREVLVVLPQQVAIAPAARYRKYSPKTGWQDFVEDAANQLASAPGSQGVCPEPGSTAYRSGLNSGDYCVQLRLTDGGPNDADGAANGVVVDPGGVAVLRSATPTVRAGGTAPANRNASAGQTNVLMLRFGLTADAATTELQQISLNASGSGQDDSDITAVRLWQDLNGDGALDGDDLELGSGSYASDNGQLDLTLTSPLVLPVGTTQFLVTYDF